MARAVDTMMESARDMAKGTMAMWVLFQTVAEVQEAENWMKGKQKVKNLTPMTYEESARLQGIRYKEIEKAMTRKN